MQVIAVWCRFPIFVRGSRRMLGCRKFSCLRLSYLCYAIDSSKKASPPQTTYLFSAIPPHPSSTRTCSRVLS